MKCLKTLPLIYKISSLMKVVKIDLLTPIINSPNFQSLIRVSVNKSKSLGNISETVNLAIISIVIQAE